LGADLQREEQARLASTQVGALQGAGVRGLIGGLGRVEAGNQMVNREIGAGLDMQQKQIDQMRAQDEANIRGMQEQREVSDIAGLSSQYNAGNAMMWQGIGGIAQSGISAISGGAFGGGGAEAMEGQARVTQATPSQINPVGGATFQQPTLMPQAIIPSQANNYGITNFRGITFNPYQQK